MAENASSDSTEQTKSPQPFITLSSEERRRQLLESLREGYPPISEVYRTISENESRYISQFTSNRWREKIYPAASDDDSEDEEQAEGVPSRKEPRKLFIYGYDLTTEEYARETEMIMRWNIVEREHCFPNLQRSRARNQSKVKSQTDKLKSLQKSSEVATMEVSQESLKVVEEQSRSTNIAMEVVQESLEVDKDSPKVTEKLQDSSNIVSDGQVSTKIVEKSQDSPNIAMDVVQESLEVAKDSPKVTEKLQDSSNIVSEGQVSTKIVEESQDSTNIAMEVVQESLGIAEDSPKDSGKHQNLANIPGEVFKESPNVAEERLESPKVAKEDGQGSTTSPESETSVASGVEDSGGKHAEVSSESNMETSVTTTRGKRKADSVSSDGEGTEDPDEKRTKTTED